MALIVGIDLGTSATVVRYLEDGSNTPVPIKDSDKSDIIPTIIYRCHGEAGPMSLYGAEALKAIEGLYYDNGVPIRNFKMDLLKPEGSEERKDAISNIKEFLGNHVLKLLQVQCPAILHNQYDLYISYPAKWTPGMSEFMVNIFKEAGFNARAIIPLTEPVAASFNMIHNHKEHLLASGLLKVGRPLHVFMLDMGAGTTDICIFRLSVDGDGCIHVDHVLPYPSIDSPSLCGGREIDEALCDYVNQYCLDKGAILIDKYSALDAKNWKDQHLSDILRNNGESKTDGSLQKMLKYIPNGAEVRKSFYIDRTVFEAITHEHWRKLYDTIKSAISLYHKQYYIGAEDIDLLCLTGGHSKWYTVENLFNGNGVYGSIGKEGNEDSLRFSKLLAEPYRISSFIEGTPQESVAKGLCYRQERVNVEMASANNYWVQLVINNQSTEIINVVKIGQVLPYKYEAGLNHDFGEMQPDYNSELQNDFRGYLKVFSGEKLDENKFETIDISLYIGILETLAIHRYRVTASCDIEVDDANRIRISGMAVFDPQGLLSAFVATKYVPFKNYKDE